MTVHPREFQPNAPVLSLAHRGRRSHYSGFAAEDQVCAHYTARGHRVLAQRWRAGRGELDLVFAPPAGAPEEVIVVEVKSARDFDTALSRITAAKAQRIFETTEQFLDTQPKGGLTDCRIDVAAVNRLGEIEVHENFFAGGF